MPPQDLTLQVGHLSGRFDMLESKVEEMQADIKLLVASENQRAGAKEAREASLKRYAIGVSAGSGFIVLVLHQIGRKLGLLS